MNEISVRAALDPDRAGPVPYVMSESARDRLRRARADSTLIAYRSGLRKFVVWAATHHLIPEHLGPSPTGPINDAANAEAFAVLLATYGPLHTIAADYVNHLADLGRAPSTLERELAAIAVAHRAAGAGRLETEAARKIIKTHRKDSADAGRTVRKAKAATVTVLRALVDGLDVTTLVGLRDRCVLVLGFALGTRRSSIAALNIADLTFTDAGLEVVIRRSKTDQEGRGLTVALPYGANPDTCPVRTTRAYLAGLAAHQITTGPLFLRIDKHGVIGRTPHGRGSADGRITGQAVGIIIRRAAQRAAIEEASLYSGHSLRRGFATESYRGGADQLQIGRHGGWKDGSATLAGYIEDADRWKSNPLTGVGL